MSFKKLILSAVFAVSAAAAQAAPVTFSAADLSNGASASSGGLNLQVSSYTGGSIETYLTNGGLYLGRTSDDEYFDLSFDQDIVSIALSFIFLSTINGAEENLQEFSDGVSQVTVGLINSDATLSFGSLVQPTSNNSKGTITYEGPAFADFQFRHIQEDPGLIGFVVTEISVNTAPVPLPAGAPLLLIGLAALAGLRRKS